MTKTNISWTEHNWNPIVGVDGGWGCNKVSEGCKFCYAEVLHKRFGGRGDYESTEHQFKIKQHIFEAPRKRKKPTMYFVCSTMDLFHHNITDEILNDMYDLMIACGGSHTFQILTKRPKKAFKYYESLFHLTPKNIWLGVTCENQKTADKRIPILLDIPARVRFLSIEPMLEKIDLDLFNIKRCGKGTSLAMQTPMLDWVIFGCESGHKRRPCDIDWVRDGVWQCREAGVPCFVKQLNIDGKVVKDINQFPKDLRLREYPRE